MTKWLKDWAVFSVPDKVVEGLGCFFQSLTKWLQEWTVFSLYNKVVEGLGCFFQYMTKQLKIKTPQT